MGDDAVEHRKVECLAHPDDEGNDEVNERQFVFEFDVEMKCVTEETTCWNDEKCNKDLYEESE